MFPAAQGQDCRIFLQLVKFVKEGILPAPSSEHLFNRVIKCKNHLTKLVRFHLPSYIEQSTC